MDSVIVKDNVGLKAILLTLSFLVGFGFGYIIFYPFDVGLLTF